VNQPVIRSLREALDSEAYFGHSPISRLPADTRSLSRLRSHFASVFKTVPSFAIGNTGFVHDLNGQTYTELSLGGDTYFVGGGGTPGARLGRDNGTNIVTGMCMFGAQSITGRTKRGKVYLTDPSAIADLDTPVTDLVFDDRIHIYEAETIGRLSSFMGDLLTRLPGKLTVHVHLPGPEYELYGLSLYARGLLSRPQLDRYREAIRRRESILDKELHAALGSKNFDLVVSSPLVWTSNFDVKDIAPERIPMMLLRLASAQNPLWNSLIATLPDTDLLGLNHCSYIYQYLHLAQLSTMENRGLLIVENPEETRILMEAKASAAAAHVSINDAVWLYVHPQMVVASRENPEDGYYLYNCADGLNPALIDQAVHPYLAGSKEASTERR
jgi:hypothetical protein